MNRNHSKCKKTAGGFTLIELLTGLTIFAVTALAAYSVGATAFHLNERLNRDQRNILNVERVMAFLVRDVQNAVAYDFSGSYPQLRAFEGSEDRIDFLIATQQGLKRVRYLSVEDPGGETGRKTTSLVREIQPLVDFLRNKKSDQRTRLVSGTGRISFVFGYSKKDDPSVISWEKEWRETFLPAAVRVVWQPADGHNSGTLSRNIFIPTGSWGTDGS